VTNKGDEGGDDMFTHILLPTDGSPQSDAAIQQGIQFAKGINAKVTGFHVIPEFHVFTYRTEMLEDTKGQFARDCRAHAEQYLVVIEKAAKDAGVTCDTDYATDDHPYEAIIKAAEKKGCDLIMMASHGRRGVQGILIGSETQKVLTHSKMPVLVYR
jgi:nucleotide-binding universal stress UspA family protein